MCSNKCIPFSQEDLCMLYFNIITFIWFSLQLKHLLSTHFHIWLPLAQPPSSTKGHLWSGNRTQHGEQHGGPTPRTWAASWWHQSMDTQFHPINRKSEMDDRLTNTLLYHYNTINLHFITWKFSIFLVSIFFLFSFVWNSRHKIWLHGKNRYTSTYVSTSTWVHFSSCSGLSYQGMLRQIGLLSILS